jgi:cell division protein FtsB
VHVSGRAAALGVLLFVLTLAYAFPLRTYLAQQAEIAQLEEDQRVQRERIQALVEQVARWGDEEYVKDQALRRLQLVEVNEQVYIVSMEQPPADQGGPATPPSWYEQVWSSVQTADDPPLPS